MLRALLRLLPAGALLGASAPLLALPLLQAEDAHLDARLELMAGTFHSQRQYGTAGTLSGGSMHWQEGYAEYGLTGGLALGQGASLEASVSAISSATWGDGDAAGFTDGHERRTRLEDAWVAWRSGDLLPALGTDGLDVSFGRQTVMLGDGFILGGDMVSAGRRLAGPALDRGGAYYLAGRTAFDQTAVIRLGGPEGVRGDLMWLKSDNHFQGEPELLVANLERVTEAGTLGASLLRVEDVDRHYASLMGVEHRKGMKMYSIRAQGNAGIDPLFLAAEYVFQDQEREHEYAWYAEVGWTFVEQPGSPALNYRYSRFSRDYDPLFYGFSRGFGTWYQGEVAANYAGPFSSNNDVHHLNLMFMPHERVAVGVAGFLFRTLDRDLGNLGGRELDLYLSWEVSDGVTLIPLVGLYRPDRSAPRGGNQLQDDDTNLYGQLLVSLSF